LCRSRQTSQLVGRQVLRGPHEIRHLARSLADDVGQVGCNPSCQGKQLVGVAADDLGNLSDFVLGGRRELTALEP
jgi:hypothetical protein